MRKSSIIVAGWIALVAVLSGSACQKDPAPKAVRARRPPAVVASNVDRRPVALEGSRKGPADALVNIVEFADFQCTFCKTARPTIERVMKEYSGQVRLFFRHLPLTSIHQQAQLAAEAALAAEAQGKFWEMHDKLYDNQQALTRADLETYARDLGLDASKFNAALDDHTYKARVERDAHAAEQVGARFTPIFFINGLPIGGAQEFREFKTRIDGELAQAERLRADGVPRDQIYARLVEGAALPAPRAAHAASPLAGRSDAVVRVDLGDAPVRGNADALVTIVEFSDFQCPFCARVQPALKQVLEAFPGKVRLVWKDNPLPFHPNAPLAALAARAAGAQGKFWEMHDRLFSDQNALDRPTVETYARQLRLDRKRFLAALDSDKNKKGITADLQQGEKLGITGTPGFFINGRQFTGAQPFDVLKALVEEQMKSAEALLVKDR